MKKPCFGILYDCRTKECQCCEDGVECAGRVDLVRGLDKDLRNGKIIAVMQILNANPRMSTENIKKELHKRFGTDSNIYYYLDTLKKKGLIDVRISGRQRLYSLR